MDKLLRGRRAFAGLVAAALALPASAQPIPPPPAAAAVLLAFPLVLVAIPIARLFRSDAAEIAELQAAGDWNAIAELASRRAAREPAASAWHELRGMALHHAGRCPEAIGDLRAAFDSGAAAVPPAAHVTELGLMLATCQLEAVDAVAAAGSAERAAVVAPQRWEPQYLAAFARGAAREATAAEAARQRLRLLHAPAAEALQAYTAGPMGSAGGAPHRWLADRSLRIADRALALPAGTWFEAGVDSRRIWGGRGRLEIPNDIEALDVVTSYAWAASSAGLPVAAAAFSATRQRYRGIGYWLAGDGCAVGDVLHLDRFARRQDLPECLYVRRIDAAAAAAGPRWGQPFKHPAPTLQGPAYEVHYERFARERIVALTVLLPALPGETDEAVVRWGRGLADAVRPLAGEAATAELSPLH